MAFIEITDNELLNIEVIDRQHEKMVDLINKLHNELGAKFEGETKRLLEQLAEITKEHFATEERLMKENNYPNYFSHKLEHDRFYNKLLNFAADVESGSVKLNLEFLRGLKRWFFNHFDLNDKKCGEYLLEKGLS